MFLKVINTVLIILEVLLIFNLMIIVHELGHFLAARWRGLVIEKFGIWFGKPLWKKKINGVEYSLGSIPAGGFVALPQLAPMEVMEGAVETPREMLPPISALDKIIVAFAGPLFSFGLAFVFALIVWKAGRPVGEAESTTTIGVVQEDSPAAKAGLKPGDKIISIEGQPVRRFAGMGQDSIMWRIVRSEESPIAVTVQRGAETLNLFPQPRVPEKVHWWNRKGLRQIGIGPAITPLVMKITPDTPGARAGLQEGDIIRAVNGEKLFGPEGIYSYAAKNPATPLTLTVDREGEELKLPIDLSGVKVGAVTPGSPAETAGLKANDIILSADQQPVPVGEALVKYVEAHGGDVISLQVLRGAEKMELKLKPLLAQSGDMPGEEAKPRIGVALAEEDGIGFAASGKRTRVYPGPFEQLRGGVLSIIGTIDALFSKSGISVQHMGGPVMMMNAYYSMLSGPEGLRMALWFSVVLNVNLALLNLLPIPVLDGGHITLALIEAIRRKPVNVRILEFVQTSCAVVIIGFMVFIAFFDVQDLPFLGGKSPKMKFQQPTPSEVVK